MEELRIPQITGTEKQIAWATDIITSPYQTAAKLAESNAAKYANTTLVDFNRRAIIYREAAEIYKAECEKAAHLTTKASEIISRRDFFSGMMNQIIHTVAVNHGFTPTNFYRI